MSALRAVVLVLIVTVAAAAAEDGWCETGVTYDEILAWMVAYEDLASPEDIDAAACRAAHDRLRLARISVARLQRAVATPELAEHLPALLAALDELEQALAAGAEAGPLLDLMPWGSRLGEAASLRRDASDYRAVDDEAGLRIPIVAIGPDELPLIAATLTFYDPEFEDAEFAEPVFSPFVADADGSQLMALLTALRSAREAVLLLDVPRQQRDAETIATIVTRWDNKLLNGYFQFPWEAALNGWLLGEDWDQPHRWQGIWLHPEVGLVLDVEDGIEAARPSLALTTHLGALCYLGDEYSWYLGVAATGALAESQGFGYGASLIAGHRSLKAKGVPSITISALRFVDDRYDDEVFLGIGFDFFTNDRTQSALDHLR